MSEQNKKTQLPISFLVICFSLILVVVPTFAAVLPVLSVSSPLARAGLIALAPVIFCAFYVGLAALLSLPFQKAIVRGKFPRELDHAVYGPRRLYGFCWGALFYFTPIYYLVISLPFVKHAIFRAFGYRGSSSANIAPDAWLRDLPMLRLSDQVYVANKATVGTNMCLSDNTILVDFVTLASRAMVGHMALIAPGSVMGEGSELGVNSALGIRARIGARSKVGPKCGVSHGAVIGEDVEIGTLSYIGVKARIGNGLKIPPGTVVPDGTEILTNEQLQAHLEGELRALRAEVIHLRSVYERRDAPGSEAAVVSISSVDSIVSKLG